MNIDKIICKFMTRSEKRAKNRNEKKKNEPLIKKNFYYQDKSTYLYVFFPQLNQFGDFSLTKKIKKFMSKNNYSFLEYQFSNELLNYNSKSVVKNFYEIKNDFKKEIDVLKQKYGFNEINIIGVSLGCVSACLAANICKELNKLFLIVPGHCLAESLWEGARTQHIRRAYEAQGFSLDKLKMDWKKLAPENNIDKLKAKKISVFLSKADIVIPYRFGYQFLDGLRNKGYNVQSKINRFKGHYLTSIDLFLRPKKYLF